MRVAGHGRGVPRDDVDVLAAAAGGLGRPNRIFDAVKAVSPQTGVLKGKTRRALDSTILDDAVATQDTVTQLIARDPPGPPGRARRGEVVAAQCTAHDYDDPGKPKIAWNDEPAREQLVDALVRDAHRLLGLSPSRTGPQAADAVALLALIAGQDVEPVDGSDGTDGRWRIAQRVAPDRVISIVDPDARHAHKTVHRRQDGFKAHLAIEPDTGIITDCAVDQGQRRRSATPRSGSSCWPANPSRCGCWLIPPTAPAIPAPSSLPVATSTWSNPHRHARRSGRVHHR